jgi:uncharacterized membrane protein YbaN (DUF454 family)
VVKPVSHARKVFDWVTGLSLIVLGVLGIILPILPGIIFLVAGVAILSSHSVLARRVHEVMSARLRRARDKILKRE